ncbi:hypothetical protein PF010_g28426 [Phytophthora fragariae]|uniref:Uncharacterized protein n=1 Tax=Phytophthora fragariae TaxID=53985 RepID=A0A6G0JRK9_9STRA|nr:hypothetical protein PF010_g28426 [Phytophthora fragariae]
MLSLWSFEILIKQAKKRRHLHVSRVQHGADNAQVQAGHHSSPEGGGGGRYEVSYRDRYECALDDTSLLPGQEGEGANAFLVAQLRTILVHVLAVDTRLREMQARVASIEELLRARPESQDRQESVTEATDALSSRGDESSSDAACITRVAPA